MAPMRVESKVMVSAEPNENPNTAMAAINGRT
jgi:hypothetical protein